MEKWKRSAEFMSKLIIDMAKEVLRSDGEKKVWSLSGGYSIKRVRTPQSTVSISWI
ncbi:MAG: hypothetical protein ACXQTD_02040 [Candidatus Syntropharchaeia archaeon]